MFMQQTTKKDIRTIQVSQKAIEILADQLQLPQKIFSLKLSCGSQRPPHYKRHYYARCVSLLRKLVENPRGVKSVCKMYKRKKQSSVTPPKLKNASSNIIRIMLKSLLANGYLNKHPKGYYTTSKGKDLLKL